MIIEKLKKIGIYFFIIVLSILPCYALFTNENFISTGHDNVFHFSQIQDLYISFKNNPFSTLISPTLNHGIGIGTRLMYGSFSHYLVVILGFIIIPFGGDLMLAYKLVILIFYFISNIFIYKLAYYISKDTSLSLLSLVIFSLFPYRFSNIYIRNAFAETIVISMLPIVFYSLVKWLKEEYSLSSYILFSISMIAIIHTHNIYTLFTFIFILIFLGINYKKVCACLKNRLHQISIILTIIACLFISSPFIISLITQANVGIYRVFNNSVMNTNFAGISASYNSVLSYFIYSFQTNWKLYSLISLIFFLIPIILYYLFDNHKNKKAIFLISYGISGILASLILQSFYVSLGFILAIIFLCFFTNEKKQNNDKLLNKSLLILCIIAVILLFFLPIWYILPSLFHKIQFIWRMWGFVSLFVSLYIPLILNKFFQNRKRYFSYTVSIGVGLLVILAYPISIDDTYFDSYNTINEEIIKNPNASGWQLEYFPEIFFDSQYQSDSSLFNEIKASIFSEEEISFSPYIYHGNSMISNYNNNKIPNISFDISVENESIVQLPLIYYKGYKITLTTDNEIKIIDNYEKDGLVTFNINQSGTIKVKYVGTTLYQIATYTQIATVIGLLVFGSYYLYQKNNCKKKDKTVQ